MIEKFKNFWSRYQPYKLHPDDSEYLYSSKNAQRIWNNPEKFLVDIDINSLNSDFNYDLKNDIHNEAFQKSFNPKAIHTNLYCKTFIGNIEKAKIIILYGNPGLKLGDYRDEHEDKDFINELDSDLNFTSNGFLFLREVAKETGGYNYWNNGNRLSTIIGNYASEKQISYSESLSFIMKNICLLESIGYHSTKTPYLKPTDFASSIITRELVHNYFLPKARNGEVIIFSWRQSNFWGLEPELNVIVRNANKARNSYLTYDENRAILNFLLD